MTNQPSPDMGSLAKELQVEAEGLDEISMRTKSDDEAVYYQGLSELMRRAAAALSQPVSPSPDMGQSVSDELRKHRGPEHAAIHTEARRRFIDFQKNPPATGDMFDYSHFVAEVAWEDGFESAVTAQSPAERLRAPVGGDGKDDDGGIGAEIARHAEKPYPQWVEPGIYYISLASEINARFASRHHHAAKAQVIPTIGDEKSDREILAEEMAKTGLTITVSALRSDGPVGFATAVALAAMARVRCAIPDGWRPIDTAKKDGSRILVQLKNPIPKDRDDLRLWDGIPFVARHPGLADDGFDMGWNFAAPVGHGGFPDEWLIGWQPIPAAPTLPIAKGK